MVTFVACGKGVRLFSVFTTLQHNTTKYKFTAYCKTTLTLVVEIVTKITLKMHSGNNSLTVYKHRYKLFRKAL